jgi:hypothetical protein
VSGCLGPGAFSQIKRPLVERSRAGQVALGLKQEREVVVVGRNFRMLTAVHFFIDRQRALEERPRVGEVALGLKQTGEVVEAHGGVGMPEAERLLADRERSLVERSRAFPEASRTG